MAYKAEYLVWKDILMRLMAIKIMDKCLKSYS